MIRDPFFLVGKTVARKYAVEAVVDEGGFSVIYRARHLMWDRPVALKCFKAEHAFTDEARQDLLRAFVREGALLAELSERCAAICQARDVATLITPRGDWVPYMVLEWLDGECLENAIYRERDARVRPRTLREAVKLLSPIADALATAHEKNVAHRDLKPGNIFVLAEPSAHCAVKLLDFGIAKICAENTRVTGSRTHSFTPSYGAPEQYSPNLGATGPWTDVFAFALILVELITGKDALEGSDIEELGKQALDSNVRPTPRARGALVSDEVEAVFARALSVDPSRRYHDARAFWSALAEAMGPNARSEKPTLPDVHPVAPAPAAPQAPAVEAPASSVPMVVARTAGGAALAPRMKANRVSVRTRAQRRGTFMSALIAVSGLSLLLVAHWPHSAVSSTRSHPATMPVHAAALAPTPAPTCAPGTTRAVKNGVALCLTDAPTEAKAKHR